MEVMTVNLPASGASLAPTPDMTSTDVVILTRFNLPSRGVEGIIRAQPDWLRNRWRLFERYCAPSIEHQADSNFSWIVYLDPMSPSWLVDAMTRYEAVKLLTPIYR